MTTRPYQSPLFKNTFSRNKVAKDGVGVVDNIIIVESVERAGVTQHTTNQTEPNTLQQQVDCCTKNFVATNVFVMNGEHTKNKNKPWTTECSQSS